jgi:RAD50-interacting protein 1
MQPILDERAQRVNSDLEWNFFNASNALITALLPMLRQKINVFLPQVATRPQLFSHFIHELIDFDTGIRDTWNYFPNPYAVGDWGGLTEEVLTKQGWFDHWLQIEKDFALSRYKDIIDSTGSGQIDYDGVELLATKPTKAAIRVNDLLETITDRYRPLSSFGQKLRFLIDIQITIFDQFHERLLSGLEAFLAMTSTIGRTVQGSDPQTNLEGVSGLERLCRIFGSAEYLEKKMQDWSDDAFFLGLWAELQNRVGKNKDGSELVAGAMSVTDVASRTSQAATVSDGALFDETASAYQRLRLRSESIIVSTLTSDLHSSLRSYSRVSTWSSLSIPSTTPCYPHPPSSELTPTIHMLSSSFSFLASALGIAPLRRISRQMLVSIQNYIWDNILMRHTFSAAGASQLASDVDHLCSFLDTALGSWSSLDHGGESRRVIGKLNDSLLLLCLEIQLQKTAEDEYGGRILGREGVPGRQLGLWEVERRLFANNDSARDVLAELEIGNLTKAEARAILEKRIEIRG